MVNKDNKRDEAKQRVREFVLESLPVMAKAMFEGTNELDEPSRAIVYRKIGAACAQIVRARRMKKGVDYPIGVDLDAACMALTRAANSDERNKRDFICRREGNTVEIRDPICDKLGGCTCLFVMADIIEPNQSLCRFCQEGHWTDHFEYMTGRRLEKMDAPESNIMGDHDCVAICHFKPAGGGGCAKGLEKEV